MAMKVDNEEIGEQPAAAAECISGKARLHTFGAAVVTSSVTEDVEVHLHRLDTVECLQPVTVPVPVTGMTLGTVEKEHA
jgi:hypothetical protein